MKILHIINKLGSGGAEKLIEESLPLMKNIEGIDINVLLLTDENNVFDQTLKECEINVDIIPHKKLYSPKNIFYIRKYIIKGKYDIVHVHLFPAFYWVSLAAKLIFKNKPKFVYTEHNTHNRRREKGYLKPVEKFIYNSYDKIISISQQTEDNLIRWLKPKDSKKFIVIENGVDIEKFINAKPYNKSEIDSEFTNDVKLICMVGRFSEQKDQATLIKAMKQIPDNVHLLLIGEGPLKEKNEDLAKEIGIKDRVHFLGFRNDIPRILKTIDIFVLSSNWEGFGLAAVEGMAAGKPVIASDVPGLRDIVKGSGLLFPVGNSDELARKINELVCEKSKYGEISKKCQERAKNYSLERMVEQYIKLYKEIKLEEFQIKSL